MTDVPPAETAAPSPESSPAAQPGLNSTTLDAVRELVLRAHPNVVPELVHGTSVEALLASVEPASQAYAAVSSRVSTTTPVIESPPSVPAGGSGPVPIDLTQLPTAKLRRGLSERQRSHR